MTKIRIKTPTSEYVIEDAGSISQVSSSDADTTIPGLPVEPGMGSGDKLKGDASDEPMLLSTTFKDKEIRFDSGRLAIVDAALLDAIDHPLEKKAIILPVKSNEVTFLISASFDDSVMNDLTIKPKVLEDDDMEDGAISDAGEEDVVIDPDTNEPQENKQEQEEDSINETYTTSNDSRFARKVREASGSILQRRHNEGKKALKINRNPISTPKRDNGGKNGHTNAERKRAAQGIKESVESFLKSNLNKTLTEDKIQNVDNREQLVGVLHMMLAMASAGWESENGNLVHPLGVTISEDKWKCKDGYLVDEKGNRPSWDFEWAYNSREAARGK